MGGTDDFYQFKKLILNLTNRCNLRCAMCVVRRGPPQTLSRHHAFEAVAFGERRGFNEIELTGGEPTLVDYFWDLLDRLGQVDTQTRLTTNGLAFTPDQIHRLAALPNLEVMVSVDGIGETHDRLRGRQGAFEAVERNLRAMAEAGCRLTVNTTMQASNLPEVLELYERLKPLNLLWHCFSLVEPTTEGAENIPPHRLHEFRDLMHELLRRAQEDGAFISLSKDMVRNYERRILYPMAVTHPGLGCTAVRKGVIVNFDGEVLPCFHYYWKRGAPYRRLDQRTLDQIVDSPEYRDEIRRAISPGGCEGCSTSCYMWDEEFFEKVLHPPLKLRLRYKMITGGEYLHIRYPALYRALRAAKRAAWK